MLNSPTVYEKEKLKTPDIPGKFVKQIKSKITLFSEKWEIYWDIYIYENNWKFSSYNNKWEKIFLNWVDSENDFWNEFHIVEKDWIILMEVYYSWCNKYFKENWEQYFPLSTTEKVKTVIDNFNKAKKTWIQQLRNFLYAEPVEKLWYKINNFIKNILEWVLNNVSFEQKNIIILKDQHYKQINRKSKKAS